MFAEAYGVPASLESTAKWISWAQDQAAQNFRAAGDQGEQATRYNLTQFWNEKAARWAASSPTDQAGLEKLDAFAHGILSRLEGQLAVLADTDSPERAAHAKLAADYQARATVHANNSGSIGMQIRAANQLKDARNIGTWAAQNTPDTRYTTAFKDAATGAAGGFLGVPLWAYGVGLLGLVLVLAMGD